MGGRDSGKAWAGSLGLGLCWAGLLAAESRPSAVRSRGRTTGQEYSFTVKKATERKDVLNRCTYFIPALYQSLKIVVSSLSLKCLNTTMEGDKDSLLGQTLVRLLNFLVGLSVYFLGKSS
uniref:uncharacterized protein LOC106997100 n=1 Tax=Macaca mulatta TaxID=9544 RepID=UPI0010A297C2|nr:uncharacterized protein LOC106997100 [Macaca mulatta]XP_045242911.1 uncharacterized protein LOC123571900 [Macaca fascicularis]